MLGLPAFAAGLALAGCGISATASPPGTSPSPSSAPTADPSAIEHASGPTDVVFRFEEGGGFVPADFFTTQAPQLTLYGDGTVIFRDTSLAGPSPDPDVVKQVAFQTVRFDEGGMQAFLKFALADSGLGLARASYRPGNVADMPTATFTINAGGVSKAVSVEGLGLADPQSPDAAILAALAGLGDRVRNFASAVQGESTWTPTRWRGVLVEDQVGGHAPWPWKDITPGAFVVHPGNDAPQFPIRTMTPAEVALLGLSDIDGGFSGLGLAGPDGKAYRFSLRPLLPDEQF